MLESIKCSRVHTRNPRVHVPAFPDIHVSAERTMRDAPKEQITHDYLREILRRYESLGAAGLRTIKPTSEAIGDYGLTGPYSAARRLYYFALALRVGLYNLMTGRHKGFK